MAAQALRVAGGAVAFAGGMVLTYEISRPKIPLPSEKERCCTFDRCAPSYDAEIDRDENQRHHRPARAGLAAARQRARGGRRHRTQPALLQARRRARARVHRRVEGDARGGGAQAAHARAHGGDGAPSSVTLAVVDAARQPFEDARFDTVVDSFGLCSFEDLAAALAEMRRCCKPGGRVLLLEHGVSSFTRWRCGSATASAATSRSGAAIGTATYWAWSPRAGSRSSSSSGATWAPRTCSSASRA